jgi:16S rRNA (adenine1518-N6/adenine1519-N6)-dimethyltransferase
MNLLQRTRGLLRLHRVFPKKRLGQHFITNHTLLQKMISYASISREDTVLEVGAGLGFLTQLLSPTCKRVIAVEIDPKLVKILRDELRDLQNVSLIEGDVLTAPVPRFNKVVSTPPYSISSPLLFWLLERRFDSAVLTFQKEFAERLTAPAGSRDYGRLTVSTYYRAEAEFLDPVPRNMFYPSPDVDSAVVRLKPRKEPPFFVEDEEVFFELVRILFTQRNKKVRNAIVPFLHKRGTKGGNALGLADSLPLHDRRVRELAPEDFGTLANEIIRDSDLEEDLSKF